MSKKLSDDATTADYRVVEATMTMGVPGKVEQSIWINPNGTNRRIITVTAYMDKGAVVVEISKEYESTDALINADVARKLASMLNHAADLVESKNNGQS